MARLGGDEFVVILDDVTDRDQVAVVARKILATLMPPMTLAGHECRTTGSIGIAVFPDHGSDAQTLTKNADMVMYLAKEEGKNDFRFFSSEIKGQSIERLMLETACVMRSSSISSRCTINGSLISRQAGSMVLRHCSAGRTRTSVTFRR